MVRITIDVPRSYVQAVDARADQLGLTRDAMWIALALPVVNRSEYQVHANTRVGLLVLDGLCDADIAAELGMIPGQVAAIRRSIGMKANRRYPRQTPIRETGSR